MIWDDKAVETLTRLVSKGRPYSYIGNLLGCSRNACIGKAKRLGIGGNLTRAEANARRAAAGTAWRKPKIERKSPSQLKAKPQFPAEPIVIVEELPPVPLHERKGILDLKESDCRWPIGEPEAQDFHFCGRTKRAGFPYCEHHTRKAYVPTEPLRMRSVKAA